MKLRLAVRDSSGLVGDVVVTADVTATVSDIARQLSSRTVRGKPALPPEPAGATAHTAPAADLTLRAEYPGGVAWSTKTKEATSTVHVTVLSDPQISIGDAVEAGPWEHTGIDPNFPEGAAVGAVEVKERFGDWPGEVPVLPDGRIVGPTPEPAP